MRCPKCGYISFDHLEVCLKCSKDVSKVSSLVEGTTYHVEAPSFLRFQTGGGSSVKEETEIHFDAGQSDFDVVDPDLDILVDQDTVVTGDTEIDYENDLGGLDEFAEEEEFEIALDGEGDNEEIGLDLGQFEDAFDDQESPAGQDEIQLDLPDELSDISDLSAPAGVDFSVAESEESPVLGTGASQDELDDFNLNLDLNLDDLGNDFSLSSPEEKELQGADDNSDIDNLSLDDIGLSDIESEQASPGKKKKGSDIMDMDGDFDFDLDLGGLSLDDD